MPYYVYILSDKTRKILRTGITNDLKHRLQEVQTLYSDVFSKQYAVNRLVYLEKTPDFDTAVALETAIKRQSHAEKTALIQSRNPTWANLAD